MAELSNGSDGLVGIGGAQVTGDLSSDAPKEDAGGREGRVRGGKGILLDSLSPLDSGNNDIACADAQVDESGQEGGGYEGGGQDNRDRYLYGSVAEADPPMDIQFQGLGLKLNETGAQVSYKYARVFRFLYCPCSMPPLFGLIDSLTCIVVIGSSWSNG
jgi:hypothetical protein